MGGTANADELADYVETWREQGTDYLSVLTLNQNGSRMSMWKPLSGSRTRWLIPTSVDLFG